MPKLSRKEKECWAFFIDPITGKRSYNAVCMRCILDCKQSCRAVLVNCPRYISRNSQAAKRGAMASVTQKERR